MASCEISVNGGFKMVIAGKINCKVEIFQQIDYQRVIKKNALFPRHRGS